MKEYKVVIPKLGFRNRHRNFEDLLNQYAREGWEVKEIAKIGAAWFLNVIKIDDANF